MLQHFRGNLDDWDPALIDALAHGPAGDHLRQPGSRGVKWEDTNTIAQMALDAIDFIDALEVGEVDLLGFSIGSFVARVGSHPSLDRAQGGACLFGPAGSEWNARLGA